MTIGRSASHVPGSGPANAIFSSSLGDRSLSPIETPPTSIGMPNSNTRYMQPLTGNLKNVRMDSRPSKQQNETTYEANPGTFSNAPAVPAWAVELNFMPATGPIDSILLGLVQRQRALASESMPKNLLIGPYHPNIRALIGPEMSNNIHPVASILTNLCLRIPYSSLAERAAALYCVYRMCQWQIWPSVETYRNLPDWYTPSSYQQTTVHPIWVSMVS